MFVVYFLGCVIFYYIVQWILKRKEQFTLFDKCGIPYLKPNFFMGNCSLDFNSYVSRLYEFRNILGDTFGLYLFTQPLVVTFDHELIKQVQIKEFPTFINRPENMRQPAPLIKNLLVMQKSEEWKQTRTILRNSFSTNKLKMMIPTIEKYIFGLIDELESKAKLAKEFDILSLYRKKSLNIISDWGFGIDISLDNGFVKKFISCIDDFFTIKYSWLLFLLIMVRDNEHLHKLLSFLYCSLDTRLEKIWQIARTVVDKRRTSNIRRNDLLQDLLDYSENEVVNYDDLTINTDKDTTSGKFIKNIGKNIQLKNDQVIGASITMLVAGHETSSSCLAFTTHLLSMHPEVQERLRKEIENYWLTNDKSDYLALNSLEYLDAVVNESLRLYPPVILLTVRRCPYDYKYKDIIIPKGASVLIPIFQMHRDPKMFENPEEFNPDRFMGKKYDYIAFQPFGNGPRNCIGARMSLLEIKLTLLHILPKFRFIPLPNASPSVKINFCLPTLRFKESSLPIIIEKLD